MEILSCVQISLKSKKPPLKDDLVTHIGIICKQYRSTEVHETTMMKKILMI